MAEVTDATFSTAVIERSYQVPVVVDLWATWCGPCKTLSPIIEKVIAETNGTVELATIDVDQNPRVSQAFQVQSIPAVFALKDGKVVDTFVGALPEHAVREFVEKLAPGASAVDKLVNEGDEESLRAALELDAENADAAIALAEILLATDRAADAVTLLTPFQSQLAAKTLLARATLATKGVTLGGDIDLTLDHLLEQAVADPAAREQFVEVLDALGPEDPRYVTYRRRLASRLY